jgi:Zn-dependent peptidase ImmA (M78 family)
MAIVAHELVHYYLGHHKKSGWDANNEKEADQLAEKWGFNIEKLRRCL